MPNPPSERPSLPASSAEPWAPSKIRLRWGNVLSAGDISFLSLSAREAHRVERRFQDSFRRAIFALAEKALSELAQGTFDPDSFDFEPLIIEHAIASMKAGLKRPKPVNLAKRKPEPAVGRTKSLKRIFEMWDAWRHGQKVPRRQAKNARTIKDVFLHTVQEFWKKESERFRRGAVYDQNEAREAFARRAKIVVSRADMIVNTETTVYFNQARRRLYDATDGVTHYLFVAIRDRRTTKWCANFHKGGRDGLVYEKGSRLLKEETPACHWNCRSELLPLSPSNPNHKRLIDDSARRRDNNSPTPLPPGWNGR